MTASLLFERPGRAAQARRRLLLISYHFPPDHTVGARRWAKLASFVAERGWGLDVVTKSDDADMAGREQLEELPSGVRVWGIPSPVLAVKQLENLASRAYRLVGFGVSRAHAGVGGAALRATQRPSSISVHDVRRGFPRSPRECLRAYFAWYQLRWALLWARRAGNLTSALHLPAVHLAVVSSGPPHVTHEAARLAATVSRLPFVMDMRDSWSLVQQLPESIASPLWLLAAARQERRLVRDAALVVANTEHARDALSRLYPDASGRIVTVRNGSDEEPLPPSSHGRRFLIVYAGTVYQDSDPLLLLAGAARVIRELGLSPERFGIELMLTHDELRGRQIEAVGRELGIGSYVAVRPHRPRQHALELMSRAAMLVVFAGPNASAIPAKTFECIRFGAWVLALAQPGSATESLLRGTGADLVRADDVEEIAAAIRLRYSEFAAGVRPRPTVQDGRFSRAAQARILLDAIEVLSTSRKQEQGTPSILSAARTPAAK